MKAMAAPCGDCPWLPGAEVRPEEVIALVITRIEEGEKWVCHMSCDGPAVGERSRLCAGAISYPDRFN